MAVRHACLAGNVLGGGLTVVNLLGTGNRFHDSPRAAFDFGNALFSGSTGGTPLDKPIVFVSAAGSCCQWHRLPSLGSSTCGHAILCDP
jgi:hypothetical protein